MTRRSDNAAQQSDADDRITVLHVDDAVSFGGSLMVVSHLVKYLDNKRFRSVVVGEAEPEVLEHLFGDRATIYRIPRAFNYVHWYRAQQAFAVIPFQWLRRLLSYLLTVVRSLLNIPYQIRLASVVVREKVDIIHQANGFARFLFLLLGRPAVATMAGIPKHRYSPLYRFLLSSLRRHIMISGVVRDAHLRAGGREDLAEIIPNPCDPEPISPEERTAVRERFGFTPDDRVFGIVGRVVEWKGQREFLAAAEITLDRIPEANAAIVGDAADAGAGGVSSYFNGLRETARGSEHGDRIHFLGYMENVRDAYALLDVLVHASIEPEPFGLVIIEAMGHGIPVVAAETGAPPEIIEHGRDGYLVDPRDPEAMADAIIKLLTDDDLRDAMGSAGREKVYDRYHAREYARKLEEVYEEVLS